MKDIQRDTKQKIKPKRNSKAKSYNKLNETGGASPVACGKESACQCGRHGLGPWSEKIPHTEEQLSLRAATIEPVL